jgi:hypothetical protein
MGLDECADVPMCRDECADPGKPGQVVRIYQVELWNDRITKLI